MTCSSGSASGVVVPGTGIHLNNMLGESDLNPEGFHRHPPGRRMPSMMSPTVLLREGSPELALAMGTARAEATGLTHRPFAEVVRDTLAWAEAFLDQATQPQVGLSPEREQELLAAWSATQA